VKFVKVIFVGLFALTATLSARTFQVESFRLAPIQVGAFAALPYIEGEPDAMIKLPDEIYYTGDNVYNDDGEHQTKEVSVAAGEMAVYHLRIQSDADHPRKPDNIKVKGTGSDSGWVITYYDGTSGGADITDQVTITGWSTGILEQGKYENMRLEVTPPADAPAGSAYEVLVTAQSGNLPDREDVVKAVTTVSGSTAADEVSAPVTPVTYSLDAAHTPAGEVEIVYSLAADGEVRLAVYDVTGRAVRELASGKNRAGTYTLHWDGRNDQGARLPRGVYFVNLKAGAYTATRKLIVVH